MKREKLEIGQKVYLKPMGWRSTNELEEDYVAKIGSKYFYLINHQFYKFSLEKMTNDNHNPDYKVYASAQEIEDEKEFEILLSEIRKFFDWSGDYKKLSLDQLKRIKAIISEK